MTLNQRRITQVACGEDHSAAVTDDGIIYTWGCGNSNKLGHGTSVAEYTPAQVQSNGKSSGNVRAKLIRIFCFCFCVFVVGQVMALQDIPIARVACGSQHTVAITAGGQLYTWGNGWKGKLGHGDAENRHLPTLIGSVKRKRFVDIECGAFHTLALTDKGHVYAWGVNDNGQLGMGDLEFRAEPLLVEELRLTTVASIAAGEGHSLFLTRDKVCWRKNGDGIAFF
jgi:E3 ubiquitin-protein ligase HERC2